MAQNVLISGIYLGNAADVDTYESNYFAENAGNLLGTYGSSSDPLSSHIVAIETDSPTIYIDTNQDTGNGSLTYDAGFGATTTKLDSFITYSSVIKFADGSTTNIVIDVVQATNGDLFLLAWDNYPILSTQGIESIQLTSIDDSAWGGFEQRSYDSVQFVCFAPGTLILTADGERPVEDLREGDLVETLDHGPQPLRWIGARRLRFPDAPDRQKPIEFRAGSLGAGVPRRRLVVSPQHRFVVAGPQVAARVGKDQAFAHAHSIVALPGVRRMAGKRQVIYISLLFDRHEVIFAEGALVESLYPGPMALAVLNDLQRMQIRSRLPRLQTAWPDSYGPMARPRLKPPSARQLARSRAALVPLVAAGKTAKETAIPSSRTIRNDLSEGVRL
ncbi:MAG: Hint domain-containing protein [Paracoccaceae bacterium]